ncbi:MULTISPECIES: co-chaperone GroES [unclassified Lactococcus]|uniref:co-chaperone GroES n=1 Tax=unclassified Lactococcus TaxID=2643510 RepID=UPI0011CB598D|nr:MULTISPECIES: co-chaperone GroES [unclassified Lactococcus]MQW22838.1 co-chaperone GroES [Lactococcus sp. dk101]TXK44611.1 co-chaperone GroES [Lactococcus sp. dk310]TXK50464.1 co-chaperone GroES [Lactococcus sp. dk322]
MLKPLEDRVVLRVKQEEEKTIGGIVLASAAQEKPQTAEVVAVGPGKTNNHGNRVEPTVQVGDIVIFEKFAGTGVKIDGEELLIIKESDLLAIVE